jgi:hypothetical protein
MRKWLWGTALILCVSSTPHAQREDGKPDAKPENRRPKLTLRLRPEIGIAPMRVVATAEFEGGSNDFEDFYCPTTVWEWGDGAVSEATSDCPPYEAGKSQIKRRYTVEHLFRRSGQLRVYFSLRQREKEVAVAGANVTIQPGGTDNSQ